jgi:signal transduction histidine kinase
VSAFKNTLNQPYIQVSDNGKEINQEIFNQIFVPFYTTKPQRLGIGLSLFKQVMLLHKSSIQVQSAEGQGSVFVLEF